MYLIGNEWLRDWAGQKFLSAEIDTGSVRQGGEGI